MKKARVTFRKCVQDSQEYGSNDEYMASRVFFDLEINGKKYENLYSNIKQVVGGDFEKDPLEVGTPENYKGPLNYQAFREAVEDYYRSLVGSKGHGIHIEGGTNIRMYGNVFQITKIAEFEVDESSMGW